MNSVTKRIETIFAQAVALQQSGRLRSTIYCQGSSIYILNQDHTLLMRFSLRDFEIPFQHPVSFNANDYDSNRFVERHGQICFIQRSGEYVREKLCKVPDLTPQQVQAIFRKRMDFAKKSNRVTFDRTFTTCLDESLSHVEFKGKDSQLVVMQRNIYSGSLIRITKEKSKGLGLFSQEVGKFPTIGLRTNDFLSLFNFAPAVAFYFSGKDVVMFENSDRRMPFVGLLSRCVYDEIGVSDGRR